DRDAHRYRVRPIIAVISQFQATAVRTRDGDARRPYVDGPGDDKFAAMRPKALLPMQGVHIEPSDALDCVSGHRRLLKILQVKRPKSFGKLAPTPFLSDIFSNCFRFEPELRVYSVSSL